MTKRANKKMMIIGLTGSIGMGKSTVAGILAAKGFPIYNADHEVHELLKKGGRGVVPVARLFPESLKRGAIDRKILGGAVFGQPKKLRQLEKILHPLVREAEKIFIHKARANKARAVILEIPLLFETGGEKRCDISLCVSAPLAVQKARVLSRPGMSEERLRAIRKMQMPNKEKRARADYVIPTGKGLAATEKHLDKLLKALGL